MIEVLRVPESKDYYAKAYEYIRSYYGFRFDTCFHEFYNNCISIYMLEENCCYYGLGYISHKYYKDYKKPIPYNYDRNNIYTLDIVVFNNSKIGYAELYDLVRTIIRDKRDRTIIVEDIPNSNKNLINALKNNKFRLLKGKELYTSTYYLPSYITSVTNSNNESYRTINPIDDLDTIDKMTSFKCNKHDSIKEAQDAYTKELLENNIANRVYNEEDDCESRQTIGQFLKEPHVCCDCCYE